MSTYAQRRDARVGRLIYDYTKGKPWLSSYRQYYRRYKTYQTYRPRSMGLPATRGYRGTYGRYKRSEKELKAIDTLGNFSPNDTPSTGQIILLNGILQGDDYFARIGREVTVKSIYIRLSMFSNLSTPAPVQIRWMVFWDKQANGAAPAFSDVLGPVSSVATTVDATTANNLSNRDRFVVVYDKVVDLNLNVSGQINFKFVKKYKKQNVRVVYNGTGATIGAIQTNSLFLMGISNYPSAASTLPVFEYFVRVRYTDC